MKNTRIIKIIKVLGFFILFSIISLIIYTIFGEKTTVYFGWIVIAIIGLYCFLKPDNFFLGSFYLGSPTKISVRTGNVVKFYQTAEEQVGKKKALIYMRIFGISLLIISIWALIDNYLGYHFKFFSF